MKKVENKRHSSSFIKPQPTQCCGSTGSKLPGPNDKDVRVETVFSNVYPNNKEFPTFTFPMHDIKMGFVSFKRAKKVGMNRKFKHKLAGIYRDPIECNKKFF